MADTSEPTIRDVLRRLDAIDRDLLSIDRRFNAVEAHQDLLAQSVADFRREVNERFDVLLGAIADIGANLTRHRHDDGGQTYVPGDDDAS